MFRRYNGIMNLKKKKIKNTFKIFFQIVLELNNKIIVLTIVTQFFHIFE